MLDVADRFALYLGARLQQRLQSRLALAKRQAAKILAVGEQQIECIEDQIVGLAIGNGGLQRGEIRRAMMVEREDLAVDQYIGQRVRFFRDRPELVRPVQTLPGPT